VLASSGFYGDIVALNKNLKVRMELYRYQHNKEMSCPAAAQMLSTVLYGKRFFPYYSFNILGGVDAEGLLSSFLPSFLPITILKSSYCLILLTRSWGCVSL